MLLFSLFFILTISQYNYPDYDEIYCSEGNNDEDLCLNIGIHCAYCNVTDECIRWNVCTNTPLDGEDICGFYGWTWNEVGEKKKCKEIKENRLGLEIFFGIIGFVPIVLIFGCLLFWLYSTLLNYVKSLIKREEYQEVL